MSKNIKKTIHICIIIIMIIAIIFTALMFILNYLEKGETNMPFEISKITIISTVDAQNMEDDTSRWNSIVNQNNDIYIDIKKNEKYNKNRIIKSVTINNFKIEKQPLSGEIKIFKPAISNVRTFENTAEYEVQEIVFEGDKKADLQNLKITNQGGRFAFRCANVNVGTYISNEENELKYDELLKKMGVTDEELNVNISFDIEILLTNRIAFNANVKLELPVDGVSENGKASREITDFDIVFKRMGK